MKSTTTLTPRHLTALVQRDLEEKMVFVAGPRQCGKTTLAREILAVRAGAYFDWDASEHRRILRAEALPAGAGLWVFDELHKMRSWRSPVRIPGEPARQDRHEAAGRRRLQGPAASGRSVPVVPSLGRQRSATTST